MFRLNVQRHPKPESGPESVSQLRLWKINRQFVSESVFVFVAFVIFTLTFFNQVAFFGKTFLPLSTVGVMGLTGPYGDPTTFRPDTFHIDLGASSWASEPWAQVVRFDYQSRQLPLWNPYQGSGSPLLANGQSGAFDILRLPVVVSESAVAWDAYYLLRIIGGAVAAYAFGRAIGLLRPAAFFLAVAYVFSGHFIILQNNMWIESYYLLPVVLLGVELIAVGRQRLGLAVMALTIAMVTYVGMPEVTLIILVTVSAYCSLQLVIEFVTTRDPKRTLQIALWMIGGGGVGIALGAPLTIPLLEFSAQSAQFTAHRSVLGLVTASPNLFATIVFPLLLGLPGEKTATNFINHYVGITVTVLALYGLLPRKTRLFQRTALIAIVITIVFLAKTFGVPGLNDIGELPFLNVTLFTKWSAPISGFFIAVLASIGVNNLLQKNIRAILSVVPLVTTCLLAVLAIYLNRSIIVHVPPVDVQTSLSTAVACALAVSLVTLLSRRGPRWLVGLLCIVMVSTELYSYASHNVYQDRYDRFTTPPYVHYLVDHTKRQSVRVMGLNGLLYPDDSSAFKLQDIRFLDALYVDRYLLYIRSFISPGVTDRFVGGPVGSTERFPRIWNNSWFDLLSVRYIVSSGPLTRPVDTTSDELINRIIAVNPAAKKSELVTHTSFTIDGQSRPVLYEHPPSVLKFPLVVTPDQSHISFAPAIEPSAWTESTAGGVQFEIDVDYAGQHRVLFLRNVDPKNNASQRHWVDQQVNLSSYLGKRVVLTLSTRAIRSTNFDWAGWGGIRLTPALSPRHTPLSQYHLVYSKEVNIYENQDALPRAFVVNKVTNVSGPTQAVALAKSGTIDPRTTAIIEDTKSQPTIDSTGPPGSATIVEYRANDVKVAVSAVERSYLVLTDTFYPGWAAYVDGKSTPIYPTDLAFRGIFVPPGSHEVEFIYEPKTFYAGVVIAFAGLTALGVVIAVGTLTQHTRKEFND